MKVKLSEDVTSLTNFKVNATSIKIYIMKEHRQFFDYVLDNHGIDARDLCCDYIGDSDITPIWGYLLEFFDSAGMDVGCDETSFDIKIEDEYVFESNFYDNRQEAQTAAKDKAFEILKTQQNGTAHRP